MKESITSITRHFIGGANLAVIGLKPSDLDLFGTIGDQVRIKQKTVKDTPIDKLYDVFIRYWLSPGADRNQCTSAQR